MFVCCILFCVCFTSPPDFSSKPDITSRQCTYNVTVRRFHSTTVAVGKQSVLDIMSLCLQNYVFNMQCACAILLSWPCPPLQYFPTLSHKRDDFPKKKGKLLHIECVIRFDLQNLSEIFLILKRREREMIKNVCWSSCKLPPYSCETLIKLEFSRKIFKK